MSSPRVLARWAVPAGLASLVVGVSLLAPVVASAEPELPDRTAAELLADLRTEPVDGFSGTVSYRADLGLPSLPGLTGGGPGPSGGGTDLTALLDGEHTLRVWAAAPDRARVSLHGELGELTLVHAGADLWTWSSDEGALTHYLLPERPVGPGPGGDGQDGSGPHGHALGDRLVTVLPPMTPEQMADLVLEALDPSTAVSVDAAVTVAGRPAYQLVLEPRTDGTLVDSVRIAIDAADRVPTRVQIFAVGHDRPAVEVGFTELSLLPPDDGVFALDPPPGATVEEVDLTAATDRDGPVHGPAHEPSHVPHPGMTAGEGGPVTLVGEGWARVLILPVATELLAEVEADAGLMLDALPRVSGAWGSGRLVTSRLFSALLTDDGRLLLGAVDAETLQRAAADAPHPTGQDSPAPGDATSSG